MTMESESYWIFLVILVCFLFWKYVLGKSRQSATDGSTSTTTSGSQQDISEKETPSFLRNQGVDNLNVIVDRFTTLEQVYIALRQAGLESCNLIFGIDFTKSNLWQGNVTNAGQNLHTVFSDKLNPYQHVIQVLGETLSAFDDDGIIPAFGFGDASTKDHSVFPFKLDGVCQGFPDVLDTYNRLVTSVNMSGPTNFAPLIHKSIEIVKATKSYHILVIVADGQVTSERPTIEAIVQASYYPLSIIMVGVGDGPWDQMDEYDNRLPRRQFDNFQFVDFHRVTGSASNPNTSFALHALMEIPDQYQAVCKLGLLDF